MASRGSLASGAVLESALYTLITALHLALRAHAIVAALHESGRASTISATHNEGRSTGVASISYLAKVTVGDVALNATVRVLGGLSWANTGTGGGLNGVGLVRTHASATG